MKRLIIQSSIVLILTITMCESAPKSRTRSNLPQTVYDQKQTGDYNIQLHLKDFQIIALLSDDTLSGLGDYDYNYDYSDFTVKPHPSNASSTTQKPPQEVPSTTTTTKPLRLNNTEQPILSSTSASTQRATPASSSPPDRIKVQILESPSAPSIVPQDDMGPSEVPALGEVLHYKRCANGYSRDKKGRCRRVRRPSGNSQVPFGISRLASTLAARFRHNEPESSSSSTSEAII